MFVHLGQKSNSKINPSEQINGIERTLATNYILNFVMSIIENKTVITVSLLAGFEKKMSRGYGMTNLYDN